eukprot:TRINITY_DN13662_c2_g1_i1.p1 TRINITY_DN13662_c2_g1~~TRINITY_DN13662_c2_g1_i1.p1  ORF type:complete len:104 (-),score=25.80 TRINITY_DN13662_c2_g1_i1:242-553(-)
MAKNGEKIDDETQGIIVHEKTLQLLEFDEDHYGSYTCKAKNDLGSEEKSFHISGNESDADSFVNLEESKICMTSLRTNKMKLSKKKDIVQVFMNLNNTGINHR